MIRVFLFLVPLDLMLIRKMLLNREKKKWKQVAKCQKKRERKHM